MKIDRVLTALLRKIFSKQYNLSMIGSARFLFAVLRGGGVQAYNFGNFNYEIQVEGEGQDTSRLF